MGPLDQYTCRSCLFAIMQNYGATVVRPQRRSVQLALIIGVMLVGLISTVCLITYARSTSMLAPVETFQMLATGNEFLVRDMLRFYRTSTEHMNFL